MSELFGVWLPRERYAPGERLEGKVLFPDLSDEKLAKVKALTVTVHALVHGSGDSEQVVAFSGVVHPGPIDRPEVPFGCELPARGPVSHQGRYVKIDWEVVAELDIPWAIDPKRTLPFTLVPRGA